MFSNLTEKLDRVFSKLSSRGRLSERDVAETMREVRRALLEADVNYRVARDFVSRVEAKAQQESVIKSFTPAQQIIKIVHEELTSLLGGSTAPFVIDGSFVSIMVVGLQGSGKTTFCAKLGDFLRKKGRRPLLIALDVYRPAATDQLEILGNQIGLPVSKGNPEERDVAALFEHAREEARGLLCDTLILDTAGRLHIDEAMMRELEILKDVSRPEEVLLVLDSMTGQEAVNVANTFNERLGVSGVVLTKLDGDARGGAALSVTSVAGTRIRFAGTGEKLGDLEIFHPDRMASRILGMGDVLSLVEKVQESIDAEQAEKLEKRLREQAFTLNDFLGELKRLKKMGSVEDIVKMIPGASKALLRGFKIDERQLVQAEAIVNSMTVEERLKPHIIDGSRRKRIARGSGLDVQSVNRFLKQFQEMQKMMKAFGKFRGKMRLPFIQSL